MSEDHETHQIHHPEEPPSILYLKCVEYACIADLIFKNLSICFNSHPFITTATKFNSKKCTHLKYFDFYILIAIKIYSILVLAYGIRACIKEDLAEFKSFRLFFYLYVGIEFLALVGISLETMFFRVVS